MIKTFSKVKKLTGELKLPGDKSISHRSIMLSSLAEGVSRIYNCSDAGDVTSTIEIFREMGVIFEYKEQELIVFGKGYNGLVKPVNELYTGNSGTTARLMCGILSAQNFDTILTGDKYLSKRPMMRIVEPLKEMGAGISASANGTLPVVIKRSKDLHPINYRMNVASAQVKSALLLAGLHLQKESIIIERTPTRNHTEKLLGLKTERIDEGVKIFISRQNYPKPFKFIVPSDVSTAAFFIVFTLLTKESEIIIRNISLNESRIGIISILQKMGGNIEIENEEVELGEKRGDLRVRYSYLKNIDIPHDIIPNIIDEIPILSIAGIFAEGDFRISGAKELRVKETDRISALCSNFIKAGLTVDEYEDGFSVSGEVKNSDVLFESFYDHRIAMSFAVLSMFLGNSSSVNNFECIGISNPRFIEQIKSLS